MMVVKKVNVKHIKEHDLAVKWINDNNIQVINITSTGKYSDGYLVFYYENTYLPEDIQVNFEELNKRFESDVFIKNVCSSYRHDFGFLSEEEQKTIIFKCKEWMRAIKNNFKYYKD